MRVLSCGVRTLPAVAAAALTPRRTTSSLDEEASGAVALLAELVRRGLDRGALVPAAALAIALNEQAGPLRTCGCGCGRRFRPARRDRVLATPSCKRRMHELRREEALAA
jgi:hypothetical protein